MRWKTGRRSSNIEDRRGQPMRRSGIKLGGTTIVLLIVFGLLTGQDPLQLLGLVAEMSGGTGGAVTSQPRQQTAANQEQADFVSVILADTEDTWSVLLPEQGLNYRAPHLVMFSGHVQSACGMTSSATGPFYCPGDQKVYIDLDFFHTLNQLGAQGDFARAYVIGHEIGHHVQNLMGTSGKVRQLQMRAGKVDGNALSVLMELQADCYAGVWAHQANKRRNLLEPGDEQEGLNAAASIGDDRLLRSSGRHASPDAFTHGSSEQRVYWLRKGLESGDMNACNTFATSSR
jgi:predicted metalloprotease